MIALNQKQRVPLDCRNVPVIKVKEFAPKIFDKDDAQSEYNVKFQQKLQKQKVGGSAEPAAAGQVADVPRDRSRREGEEPEADRARLASGRPTADLRTRCGSASWAS